eukprot:CAMPEP_0175763084 /NCGR_PEP_ID=MMETSP0097-20121207/67554_1 /TAXON_ID=311494 /ORGANISM="Alexandrium monilatum, Strain CCMP3105" /LENGTH=61 /DNA_ID=CAMNT_0017072801 /DNA_START=40 /DNA_END=222 /DNA_ORIENTATION=+
MKLCLFQGPERGVVPRAGRGGSAAQRHAKPCKCARSTLDGQAEKSHAERTAAGVVQVVISA